METLDRAKTHYQSLKRVEERGKTSASMAITVRLNILDKDEPRFKSAWIMAIMMAEKSLMTTKPLRVILKVKNNIKAAAADAIKWLQTIHDRTTTREAIEETIQSANQNETRQ